MNPFTFTPTDKNPKGLLRKIYKERAKIYEGALAELAAHPIYYRGLCHVMSKTLRQHSFEDIDLYTPENMAKYFPELWAQRPQDNYDHCWWWKPFDYSPRINALQLAILEIERKMRILDRLTKSNTA